MISRVRSLFTEDKTRIIDARSNVIQYDIMGNPLRLVIMDDGKQAWRDTHERDGDVVLKWEESE